MGDIINKKVFTLKQIAEFSKSEKKPKGFSRQYLNKEIERGNLKATKFNGLHLVEKEEAIKYLSKKNIILQI
jgi:hypothetical protein